MREGRGSQPLRPWRRRCVYARRTPPHLIVRNNERSTMQFADLSLDLIEPSPINPRRHRNKLEDADLMASISTHGILTPLLVRPLPEAGKYQIAAGHRRYEAAKKLSLATIPVQIRE